ncbi:MAG: hypothetical protein ACHQ6U_05140 [Thermodesulfobacteriota bacterium]
MSDNTDRYLLTIFKDGFNKGLRTINIRSKEAYDVLKIKNALRRLDRRRKEAVFDMGSTVYRTFKHTGKIVEESIGAKCAEIEKIETEIGEWEERLELVHANANKALGSVKAITKPSA